MASKASFTPDEWHRIVGSPLAAGMAVTAADPSGLFGLLKESFLGGMALLEAKRDAGANALVKAVADDLATAETREGVRANLQTRFKGAGAADLKHRAVEELRAVSAILNVKAPEDAAAFKAWLGQVAQRAAEAANEGGFLGFGGVAVSEAEKATLAEITAALNTPVSPSQHASTGASTLTGQQQSSGLGPNRDGQA